MKQSREWLAGAVLAACGVVFALLLLEAGVRWLHLLPDRFWEPDPVLGARLTAGKSGWWTQEEREFLIHIQINSHGLRDVEHEYVKPAGVYRILILGDSFIEALQVPLEETLGRRLETELRDAGRRVEVISAGVSGYGTAGAVLFFEREGVRYNPDLVVLAFYPGNDVGNNSETIEATLRPVYGSDGELQRIEGAGKPETGARDGWLNRSAAVRYLRKVVLTRQPALAEIMKNLGLIRTEAIRQAPQREGIPVAYGVYAEPLAPEWDDAWKRTERLLGRLRKAVGDTGGRLLIAVLTTREQIYPDTWERTLLQYPGMRSRQWNLDAPQARLSRWCAAAGADCVQLDSSFRQARDAGAEPLHFQHDGHWTAAGHGLAAKELTTFIERQRWLPLQEEKHDENG